ncbi:MAG: glucose 1-dehydrogenase [Pseudomonadota bacterium]
MNSLHEKTALITGAASGFGLGIATAFVEAGARVCIVDIDADAAQAAAANLGENAKAVPADITQNASFSAAVDACYAWGDQIDILVNNAGVGLLPTPLEQVAEDDFKRLSQVNMYAIYLACQLVVPRMKTAQAGTILNIASTAGVSPRPNLTWYNASKGWVITATKSMAVELAPFNIRVNAINPVAGETPLLATFMGEDTSANRERFLATIPLGRFSTPADIGAAATFLCSDDAAMITGVAMEVDGGRCV